jgi:hypothetical protein
MTLAEQLAHRTIVAAVVLGLTAKPKRSPRVVVGDLAAIANTPSARDAADYIVVAGANPAIDQASTLAKVRAAMHDDGVLAWVSGSPVTDALVTCARDDAAVRTAAARDDAYGSAIAWATARAELPLAPAIEREHFGRFVEAAAAAGLVLVEAEAAALAPGLARVRGMRSPRARALLATIAFGAGARPLVFATKALAPKNGLARLKVDRLADAWVARGARSLEKRDAGDRAAGELFARALAALDDATEPMPFKDLLRRARERRAQSAKITASSSDASELAASLYRAACVESVQLFALDPKTPGWTLTNLMGEATV